MTDALIHLLMVAILPLLMAGVVIRVKAMFAGRRGAPIWQPLFDIIKLLQKGMVISTTTTWVFLTGPVVALASTALALTMVPLGVHEAPIRFVGDAILLVYLLGLGRFFLTSAALDTGSAFEGMGSAREVTFACLAEPAFFCGLLVLAQLSGEFTLAGMLTGAGESATSLHTAALLLVVFSWFIVLLAENCRIPFDDPNTHLELTMIHEVIVLDHSGPALGVILYAASLKLFLFSALVVRLAVPWSTGTSLGDWGIFFAAMLAVAAIIGAVESTIGRLRMLDVPKLLTAAGVLAVFGLILVSRQ